MMPRRFIFLLLACLVVGCDRLRPAPTLTPTRAATATPRPTPAPPATATPTPRPDGLTLLNQAMTRTSDASSYQANHEFYLRRDEDNQVAALGNCVAAVDDDASYCTTEFASLVDGQLARQTAQLLRRDEGYWVAPGEVALNWQPVAAGQIFIPGYVAGVIDPVPFLATATAAEVIMERLVLSGAVQTVLRFEVDLPAFLSLLLGPEQGPQFLASAEDLTFDGRVWIDQADGRIVELTVLINALQGGDALGLELIHMLRAFDEIVDIPRP